MVRSDTTEAPRGEMRRRYEELRALSRTMTAAEWSRMPEADELDALYDTLARTPRESGRGAHTPGPWQQEQVADSAGVGRPVVMAGGDMIAAVSRANGEPMSVIGDGVQAEREVEPAQDGMSLRDYFAGQALAGMCGFGADGPLGRFWNWLFEGPLMSDEEIAVRAYEQADAMLAARSHTEGDAA